MKPKIPDFNITEPYYQGVTVDPVDYDLQGYDFSILNASLDKQEKRMEAAQEKLAGINAALGEFKQKVIDGGGNYEFIDELGDEVRNDINYYIGLGDYQGAKDAATRAASKVVNNTELTARIKTSEQKRAWDDRKQKLVDAGKISPLDSAYLDYMNPYYHKNKYKDGKIVGAEDWKGDELYESWNAPRHVIMAREALMAEKSSGGNEYNVDDNGVTLNIVTKESWDNESKTAERIRNFAQLMAEKDPTIRYQISRHFNSAYFAYDNNLKELETIDSQLASEDLDTDERDRLVRRKNELTTENYGLSKQFNIVNGKLDLTGETIDAYMYETCLPEVAKQLSYNWKTYTNSKIGGGTTGSKPYSDVSYNDTTGKVSYVDVATKQRLEVSIKDFVQTFNISEQDVKQYSSNFSKK